MRVLVILVVAAGCRVHFDPTVATDAPSSDAVDAPDEIPGLLARYTCDALDGSVLPDVTSHGHDGSCTTCPDILTPARIGAAACRFHGTGERITVGTIGMSTFAVAAWMYVDTLPATTMCPYSRTFGSANQNSWQLCVDGTNLRFYTYGTSSPTVSALGKLAAMQWVHTIIEWDGQKKSILIDGVLAASSPADDMFDTGLIYFGEDLDGGVPIAPYDGFLDDIRIYDRTLTADEIDALIHGS